MASFDAAASVHSAFIFGGPAEQSSRLNLHMVFAYLQSSECPHLLLGQALVQERTDGAIGARPGEVVIGDAACFFGNTRTCRGAFAVRADRSPIRNIHIKGIRAEGFPVRTLVETCRQQVPVHASSQFAPHAYLSTGSISGRPIVVSYKASSAGLFRSKAGSTSSRIKANGFTSGNSSNPSGK